MKGLDEAWQQLDAEVDQISALVAGEKADADNGSAPHPTRCYELEKLKARARGKAEILAVFMTLYGAWGHDEKAHVWTADEISTEAGKRRAMRLRGRGYFTILTLGQLLQYEADSAWKRDGQGFLELAR